MDTDLYYLFYDKKSKKFRYFLEQSSSSLDGDFITGFFMYLDFLDLPNFSRFSIYTSSNPACFDTPPNISSCEFVSELVDFILLLALPVPEPSFPLLSYTFH